MRPTLIEGSSNLILLANQRSPQAFISKKLSTRLDRT
jgi:hypothetical protein